jgi:hypothetical protein
MPGIQNAAGMGSGKTARPDEKMGSSAGKHLHTGSTLGDGHKLSSAQKQTVKKMAARKRRQRDQERTDAR